MLRRRGAGRQLLKDMNTLLMLEAIQQGGPISRISLARKTGLAPSTVTTLARRLISAGVIVEGSKDESSPRRKAVRLHFSPDAYYALAVDLGKYRSTLALLNLAGEVVRQADLLMDGISQATVADRLTRALRAFVDSAGESWQRICGVGVGVPGIVDPTMHIVKSPVAFGWARYVALDTQLERALGVPVIVDNDTNAAAIAERLYGAAMGLNGDLIYVTIGEGVGAGIVIGGSVYRGAQHGAGEFGHTTVNADGPECRCGSRGCVENFASVSAIVQEFYRASPQEDLARIHGLPPEDVSRLADHIPGPEQRGKQLSAIVEAAREGHQTAAEVLTRAATRLGQGLINIINLFDPQLIVLGGSAGVMGEFLLAPVRRIVNERTGIVAFDPERIVLSRLGDDGEVKGLAALVVQRRFSLEEPLPEIIG